MWIEALQLKGIYAGGREMATVLTEVLDTLNQSWKNMKNPLMLRWKIIFGFEFL